MLTPVVTPDFDLLAPGLPELTALVACRLTGVLLIAPVFSARVIPARLKAIILILLAVLLQPVAQLGLAAAGAPLPALTPAAAMAEMVIGVATGAGAALVIGAAETAGDLMAMQMGLSAAAMMDPAGGPSMPTLAHLTSLVATGIFLAVGAHLMVIDHLAATFDAVPVGSGLAWGDGLWTTTVAGGTLFALGLKLAAPIVAVTVLANVMLGVLTRAAPTLNILTVAFPLQIAAGLAALWAALPFIAPTILGSWDQLEPFTTRLLGAFYNAPAMVPGGTAGGP